MHPWFRVHVSGYLNASWQNRRLGQVDIYLTKSDIWRQHHPECSSHSDSGQIDCECRKPRAPQYADHSRYSGFVLVRG